MTQTECTVALVGAEEAPTQHLKSALEQSGAQVVFESSNIEDELDQLKESGANHWVLSLDPDGDVMDAIFDAVDELDGVEIILDDPAVSSHLEGWDLARWARHLAAKILKTESLLPPIPEHAAKLDLPMDRDLAHLDALNSDTVSDVINEDIERGQSEHAVDEASIPMGDASDIPDFSLSLDDDWDNEASNESSEEQAEDDASFELVDDKTAIMRSDDSDKPADESLDAFDEAFANFADGLDEQTSKPTTNDDDWEMPDLSAFAEQADDITGAPKLSEASVDSLSLDDISLDDLDASESSDDVKKKDDLTDPISDSGLSELLDFDAGHDDNSPDGLVDFDEAFANLSKASETQTKPDQASMELESNQAESDDDFGLDFDAEFERLAAEIDDEAAAGSSDAVLDVAPWEVASTNEPSANKTVEPTSLDTTANTVSAGDTSSKDDALSFDFSNLSLMDMEDEASDESLMPSASLNSDQESSLASSLNKKEEALAEIENSGAFDGLSLEEVVEAEDAETLIPTTESPPTTEKKVNKLDRIIAIGSSIGGPDALRSLLTELPKGIQAAIVIAQHLDGPVFERLAKQLDKACNVTVLLASDLLPLRYGSVMVVPEKSHLIVNLDGHVKVMDMEEDTPYSPDISKTFSNLAEMFGDKLTAIVLSGMAGDAVDGAAKVVEKGGEVWVQSVESCVVGTMVEGVMALGIHSHEGTPRELGRRCIEKFGVQQTPESE